jgi:hypothetical protein
MNMMMMMMMTVVVIYSNKLVRHTGGTLNMEIKISTCKLHRKLGELFALQAVRTSRCHLCVQQPQKKNSATYVSRGNKKIKTDHAR